MVPGGECHRKEANGTKAREGIQDNVKPDSGENRPALSFLTSALAGPSAGFPSLGDWGDMTLNSQLELPPKSSRSSGWKEEESPCPSLQGDPRIKLLSCWETSLCTGSASGCGGF